MSVSNGALQTIIQGRGDETDTPPELVSEPANDDEAPTVTIWHLLYAKEMTFKGKDGSTSIL